MSLEKHMIPVSLDGSLDTKTDPKRVVQGRFLTLENAIFISPGRIKKRPGYAQLSNTVLNGSAISVGQMLAAYNNELLMADASTLYSYDLAQTKWVNRGFRASTSDTQGFQSAYLTQAPIVRNTYQQTQQDSAQGSTKNVQCFVYEDSNFGTAFTTVDTASGQVLGSGQISATGIKPKVLTTGIYFTILYVDTSDNRLHYGTINYSADPTTLTLQGTITTNSGNSRLNLTKPNYDAFVSSTAITIAWNDMTPGGGVSCTTANTSGSPAWSFSSLTLGISEAAFAISVFSAPAPSASNALFAVAYYTGSALKYSAFDNATPTPTVLGSGTIETLNNVSNVTGVSTSSSALSLVLFYSVAAAPSSLTYNFLTRQAKITGSYSVAVRGTYLRSVGLAGKAFAYSGLGYVALAYQSPLQSTYFVADEQGKIVAKALYGAGGGLALRTDSNGAAMLSEANSLSQFGSATQWEYAFLEQGQLTTTSGKASAQTGVTSVTLDFYDSQNSYQRVTHANTLHISGGYLQMYDGAGPVEHGFHLYPEPVFAQLPGEFLPYGLEGIPNYQGGFSYQYAACYEWTDNRGQIHRSAPSVAFTYRSALAVGGAFSPLVVVPTLRLTAKQNARSPVRIVIYRTANNGTTFYQSTSTTAPIFNDPTVDTVTFTDSTNDAALIGNPLLYTGGGVVQNGAPDAVASLTTYRNRVVALSSVKPLQVWYSKEVVPGTPVEFSPFFTLNIDPRGGNGTAVAGLDDKLIIFKSTSIMFEVGQGPDSTGGQNDFSDTILVTTDAGCTNPRSIVLTPKGLMFQSAKGIYLLDRSLGVSYVGAEVEAYNSYTITSAVLLPNTNQVRFTLSGQNTVLMYDYLMERWSTFTSQNGGVFAAVDAANFQSLYTYLRPGGIACQENATNFTDAGIVFGDPGLFIRMRAVTSWLSFAGLQGFQRVYKLLLLGQWIAAHNLTVKTYYNFDPNTVGQTDTITNIAADPNPYQYRFFLTTQKCQAIQISVEDGNAATASESFNLTALAFEVGLKKGVYKLPAASSLG